ncbi:MAG: hypothetical protein JW395_0151 [Nitrospira sp.]|nr:hypothetical protein [Nitrospira sp.]
MPQGVGFKLMAMAIRAGVLIQPHPGRRGAIQQVASSFKNIAEYSGSWHGYALLTACGGKGRWRWVSRSVSCNSSPRSRRTTGPQGIRIVGPESGSSAISPG